MPCTQASDLEEANLEAARAAGTDGKLDFTEFSALMRANPPDGIDEVTDEMILNRFRLLDADGSGSVSSEEYLAMLRKQVRAS